MTYKYTVSCPANEQGASVTIYGSPSEVDVDDLYCPVCGTDLPHDEDEFEGTHSSPYGARPGCGNPFAID